jgi:O-antigen/teichoic acid export membrane protein
MKAAIWGQLPKNKFMSESTSQPKATGQERILRNTSYLTGAFIIQKILSFLYFIFIAKALGAYDLGLYDPAKALIPILLILIDFSLSTVLTREVARRPEKSFIFLSNVLAIKAIFAVILLVLFGVITNFSSFAEIERSVIYLIALVVAFDSFTATFFAVFRGLQNMKYEAFGMIITQFVTIVIGLLSLHYGEGIRGLFLATLSGSIINFFYAFTVIKKRLGIMPSFRWEKDIIKTFLKTAVPFALAAILAKIFTYTDRFVLLIQSGREFVGYYATANKLTFALEFLPSAFAAAFYPAMSAAYISNKKLLSEIFEQSLFYLIIIAVPIATGSVFLAKNIFVTLWAGDYLQSILPFQIMVSSIIVIFLNFPVGSFLNATNNQKINTINMAVTVLVNIALNLILVTKFQHVGSAISTALSEVLLFCLGLRRVNRLITYNKRHLLITLFGSAAIALFLSIGIDVIARDRSLYILLPLYGILYVCGLFTFKIFTRQDITVIVRAIISKKV